jgi:hypothetical protein
MRQFGLFLYFVARFRAANENARYRAKHMGVRIIALNPPCRRHADNMLYKAPASNEAENTF